MNKSIALKMILQKQGIIIFFLISYEHTVQCMSDGWGREAAQAFKTAKNDEDNCFLCWNGRPKDKGILCAFVPRLTKLTAPYLFHLVTSLITCICNEIVQSKSLRILSIKSSRCHHKKKLAQISILLI